MGRPKEMTPTQEKMWCNLEVDVDYTYKDIAELIGVDKTNLNKQVKFFIDRGLMVKQNTRPVKVRFVEAEFDSPREKFSIIKDGKYDDLPPTPPEPIIHVVHNEEQLKGVLKSYSDKENEGFTPPNDVNMFKHIYRIITGKSTTNLKKIAMKKAILEAVKRW